MSCWGLPMQRQQFPGVRQGGRPPSPDIEERAASFAALSSVVRTTENGLSWGGGGSRYRPGVANHRMVTLTSRASAKPHGFVS